MICQRAGYAISVIDFTLPNMCYECHIPMSCPSRSGDGAVRYGAVRPDLFGEVRIEWSAPAMA